MKLLSGEPSDQVAQALAPWPAAGQNQQFGAGAEHPPSSLLVAAPPPPPAAGSRAAPPPVHVEARSPHQHGLLRRTCSQQLLAAQTAEGQHVCFRTIRMLRAVSSAASREAYESANGDDIDWRLALAQAAACHDSLLSAAEGERYTILHYAARTGMAFWMRLLLKFGAQEWSEVGVNLASVVDANGDTPLHACVSTGDRPGTLECARLLLECGADPNAENAEMLTPLHCAARRGHVGLACLLVDHGADGHALNRVNELGYSWTPLWLAVKTGRLAIARKIIASGAHIEADPSVPSIEVLQRSGGLEHGALACLARLVPETAHHAACPGLLHLHKFEDPASPQGALSAGDRHT